MFDKYFDKDEFYNNLSNQNLQKLKNSKIKEA